MGITELVLIAVFAYLLFGSNKLTELVKSIGKAKKSYKESVDEIDVHKSDVIDDPELVKRQQKYQKKDE